MVSKQMIELVRALRARGFEDKIDWKETDNPYVFVSPIGGATIRVREEPDFSGRAPSYFIDITRDERILDSVSDEELSGHMKNSYLAMSEIYGGARAKALGIDKIVGSVLKALGNPNDNDDGEELEDEIPF